MWLDDVIKLKHFPRYWPFARGIHRSPVNSPHKGQWRGVLMLSLICARINGWVNNREAGDLRRHRVHYDVIVKKEFHVLQWHRSSKHYGFIVITKYCWPKWNYVSQTKVAMTFSWTFFLFWFKYHRCLLLKAQLTLFITGSANDLALNRRRAITWSKNDPVHWYIYASAEHNKFFSNHVLGWWNLTSEF